jgi:branched-subunit amino acid aminotransferase/4-amino-4-deoxychorismate lyase
VTRDVILEEAVAMGLDVVEDPFGLARLLAADMVFISASVRGCARPSRSTADPSGSPGTWCADGLSDRYRRCLAEG